MRPLYLSGRDGPLRRFAARLRAISRLPLPPVYLSLRSGDLSRAPENVNVLLGRLVDAGALYCVREGEYAYTAPELRRSGLAS